MSLENLVSFSINSLGYLEDGTYYREPDCFETVKDLIKFLHRDNKMVVRKLCAVRNIVSNDLVPIMKSKDVPDDLFDACLRLTVNLCQPTLMAFGNKHPDDNDSWKLYYELEANLRKFLSAFTDQQIFRVFLKKMRDYFTLDWESRNEKSKLLVERIIVLIREIFAVGTEGKSLEKISKDELQTREKATRAYLTSGIVEFFIELVHNSMERDFCIHIMTIFAEILQPFNPSDIASTGTARLNEVLNQENEELQKAINYEREKINMKRFNLTKRNFLGGTYLVKGSKALNQQNELVLQKPIIKEDPIDVLAKRKTCKRAPKNRRVQNLTNELVPSGMYFSLETRIEVKKFVNLMVEQCYNKLMKISKDQAFNTSRSQTFKYSESNYFSLAEFILEYARLSNLPISQISMTFSKDSFHHILVQLDNYFEMIKVDKPNFRFHAFKAQSAISAYRSMVLLLYKLFESKDSEERDTFNHICHHIFKVEEFREFGFNILSHISANFLSKKILQDVVLVNHYYILIMEKYTKKGELIKVEKKKRIANRRRKAKRVREVPRDRPVLDKIDLMSRDELESLWSDLLTEVNDVLSGIISPTTDVSPIDALITVDDAQQQAFAMLSIQRALRDRRVCDAVGVYRAARELWPEGSFGKSDSSLEEETSELREIFFADFNEIAADHRVEHKKVYGSNETLNEIGGSISDQEKANKSDKDDETDEERDDMSDYIILETQFSFDEYISNFAKAEIIAWYIMLLKDFESNSDELNKAIIKLFHRIAFDLKAPPRLYQASLFVVLLKVNDQFKNWPRDKLKVHKHFKLYEFGFHLLRRFFDDFAKRGELLALEMLFPKTARESYEIQYGYASYEGASNNANIDILWPEDLEEELKSLYYEYIDYDDEEAKQATDLVSFIENGLSKPRTTKQITTQLKRLGISYKKSKTAFKKPIFEHSTEELKNLINQYNGFNDDLKGDKDLIDYLRNILPGEYSRKKMIKEINYRGIPYEKDKKKLRKKEKETSKKTRSTSKNHQFVNQRDPLTIFDNVCEPSSKKAFDPYPLWKPDSPNNKDHFDKENTNENMIQGKPRYRGFALESDDDSGSDSDVSLHGRRSPKLLENLEADTFDLRLDVFDDHLFQADCDILKKVRSSQSYSHSQKSSRDFENRTKERRFIFDTNSDNESMQLNIKKKQDSSDVNNLDTFNLRLEDTNTDNPNDSELRLTLLSNLDDEDVREQNPVKKRRILSDDEDE